MKILTLAGAVAGFVLLLGLGWHTNLSAMLQALASGGWALLWVLPYRALFFLLYARGWAILLQSANPDRSVALGYVFWVTSVREAVDRLLPVASVGGSFIGVRLMLLRGFDGAAVSASVIVEIVLTLISSYLFAALGLVLLAHTGAAHPQFHRILTTLLLSVPLPLALFLLLRYGSVFTRLEKIIRTLCGLNISAGGSARLDCEVISMLRNRGSLVRAGALELIAIASGSFEIWFAMRLFGRPVSIPQALILESMTVALRHVAFIVPAGIGVQEAGLVTFGQILGIESEFTLAVSMIKRVRELIWGLPSLVSWQWFEGRRLATLHA